MGHRDHSWCFYPDIKDQGHSVISSWFAKESDLVAELLLLFCYRFVETLINSWELKKHFQAKHNFDYLLLCESFVA